jgi:hypothetical protein
MYYENILVSRPIKITIVEGHGLQYTYYYLLGNLQ